MAFRFLNLQIFQGEQTTFRASFPLVNLETPKKAEAVVWANIRAALDECDVSDELFKAASKYCLNVHPKMLDFVTNESATLKFFFDHIDIPIEDGRVTMYLTERDYLSGAQ